MAQKSPSSHLLPENTDKQKEDVYAFFKIKMGSYHELYFVLFCFFLPPTLPLLYIRQKSTATVVPNTPGYEAQLCHSPVIKTWTILVKSLGPWEIITLSLTL